MELLQKLQGHLQNIVEKNYGIGKDTYILLVHDTSCELARTLAKGYTQVISGYKHAVINFDATAPEDILAAFEALPERSLVILVQSLSFRITKDRLRADLFRKGHMVIEHARLSYNKDDQIGAYVDSLEYNTPKYIRQCDAIEAVLEKENIMRVISRDEQGNELTLTATGPFERFIKNTGDLSDKDVPAAGFPIGEVFTEAQQLDQMNGSIVVFGFPNKSHITQWCDPFTITIKDGLVVSHTGPQEFDEILEMIKADESGTVQVREIGFGLNSGFGFDRRVDEPTSFERFSGIHFSLGLKHAMFRKKLGKKVWQKYHIDSFCRAEKIYFGEQLVFENGAWQL